MFRPSMGFSRGLEKLALSLQSLQRRLTGFSWKELSCGEFTFHLLLSLRKILLPLDIPQECLKTASPHQPPCHTPLAFFLPTSIPIPEQRAQPCPHLRFSPSQTIFLSKSMPSFFIFLCISWQRPLWAAVFPPELHFQPGLCGLNFACGNSLCNQKDFN